MGDPFDDLFTLFHDDKVVGWSEFTRTMETFPRMKGSMLATFLSSWRKVGAPRYSDVV